MSIASPLRYPGGKACLTEFLSNAINLNDLGGCTYFEPYAGGAGAALELLKRGIVSQIYLNDADPRIYAFWQSALCENNRFVDKLYAIPLTIEEWRHQQEICTKPSSCNQFELGFAAFYMNRCNRSGVISGSGPIGGYQQTGTWKLDARFDRDTLAERILKLKYMKKNIQISCHDAIVFLKKSLPRGGGRKHVFAYLDPPYVNNGQRLYLNAYKEEDHTLLARYLNTQRTLPWIVSYDDSNLVRKLYARHNVALMPIRYTLQKKRTEKELIISPYHLAIPHSFITHGHDSSLMVAHHERKSHVNADK